MTGKRRSPPADNRVRLHLELLEDRRAPSANTISTIAPAMPDGVHTSPVDAIKPLKIDPSDGVHASMLDLIHIERGDASIFELVVTLPRGQQFDLGFGEFRAGPPKDLDEALPSIRFDLAASDVTTAIELENVTAKLEPPAELANRAIPFKPGSVLIDLGHEHSTHELGKSLAGDGTLDLVGVAGPNISSVIESRTSAPITPSISNASSLTPTFVAVAAIDARLSIQIAPPSHSAIQPASDIDSIAFADPGSAPDVGLPDYPTPAPSLQPSPALDLAALPPPSINSSDVVSHFTPLDPNSIQDSIARFIDRLQNGKDSGSRWLSPRRIALLGAVFAAGFVGFKFGQRRGLTARIIRLIARPERKLPMTRLRKDQSQSDR